MASVLGEELWREPGQAEMGEGVRKGSWPPFWAGRGGHQPTVAMDMASGLTGASAVIPLSPGWVPRGCCPGLRQESGGELPSWEMPLMMVRPEKRKQGFGAFSETRGKGGQRWHRFNQTQPAFSGTSWASRALHTPPALSTQIQPTCRWT